MRRWAVYAVILVAVWLGIQFLPFVSDRIWTDPKGGLSQTVRNVWNAWNQRDGFPPEMSASRCFQTLKEKGVTFRPIQRAISERQRLKGCHRKDAVSIQAVDQVKFGKSLDLSCRAALALTTWIQDDLQRDAQTYLNEDIGSISTMGTFSCRNIAGTNRLSQHATANAIDIGGFRTKSGRRISVLNHWKEGRERESRAKANFLKAVGRSACEHFNLVLSPDFNKAHEDHFHFDMGRFRRCRVDTWPNA